MSALSRVKKNLAAGALPPVQLWYGEDRYSMIEALRLLKKRFLEGDPSGSSIEVFSGKDALKLEEVVGAARTPGFFTGRLVVIDSLAPGKSDDGDAGGMVELVAYCQEPNPSNCLVILAEKINRTRKLYKVIAKKGSALEFAAPENFRAWQEWVRDEAGGTGKKISPAAAGFLLDWCGHHVGILSQELHKCALFVGDRPEIVNADIKGICLPRAETSIFALLDAIARRRVQDALSFLRDVLRHEYYMKVHGMIVRHIRLLLAACLVCGNEGYAGTGGRDALMTAAGIRSPYEAGKIMAQAKFFAPDVLADFLCVCLGTEVKIKTGGGEAPFLLEVMVVEFCR